MDKLEQDLEEALKKAAQQLRGTSLVVDLSTKFEELAAQVYLPCVVAVVGQVKVGKSSFINALLGDELAKVGTNETTATINYFRYASTIENDRPDRPIRCVWQGGRSTSVDKQFLDSLQGNDIETLRKAEKIDHLEYLLSNPYLQQVTLVDTPGTGAAVDEHQNRTAEFMHMYQQLRERHNKETQDLGDTADAIIYLIGATASSSDQMFLEEFQQVTQGQSRAFNAIGVMSKIDLNPDVVRRRNELAAKIATQLKDSLNTVIPVSAGIRNALNSLLKDNRAELNHLITSLRSIPPTRLKKLLDNEQFYLELDPPDCPVSPEARQALLGTMPWRVFTTIAVIAADASLDENAVVEQLNTLTGFDQLNAMLDRHILKRSRLLRCYRITNDARRLLNTIKFRHLPEIRKGEREEKAKMDHFLRFIASAQGDQNTARELDAFIRAHTVAGNDQLERTIKELDRLFSTIFQELRQYNDDFEALHKMEDFPDCFSSQEAEELEALFGLYGIETEKRLLANCVSLTYVQEQQQIWMKIQNFDSRPARREVAEQAVFRYGCIIDEMIEAQKK